MNGLEAKREIERIFKITREMFPAITDDMLDSNGAIYYMNGNDGTDFDWGCNGRLCEFYIFHKNEVGFIKVLVTNNNAAEVFIYENGESRPTKEFKENLNVDAYEFAKIMYEIADSEELWDKIIDEFYWDVESMACRQIED